MRRQLTRREFLKYGAVGVGGGLLLPAAAGHLLETALRPTTEALADSVYVEAFPTSPLILNPFNELLPIPRALAPVPRSEYPAWRTPPGPGIGQQDSDGGRHQLWPSRLGLPDPIVYRIKLQVGAHRFTSSKVLPIDRNGGPVVSWDERRNRYPAGTERIPSPKHHLRLQRHVPGPQDQCRVRPAGDRAL